LGILCTILNLYVLAIVVRIVLSYFPLHPGTPVATVFSYLYRVTEPVMGPARRIIPSVGMFDFSPIVVIFALRILGSLLFGC
jgi:YggT family protein